MTASAGNLRHPVPSVRKRCCPAWRARAAARSYKHGIDQLGCKARPVIALYKRQNRQWQGLTKNRWPARSGWQGIRVNCIAPGWILDLTTGDPCKRPIYPEQIRQLSGAPMPEIVPAAGRTMWRGMALWLTLTTAAW